jgi:hypothetical protein
MYQLRVNNNFYTATISEEEMWDAFPWPQLSVEEDEQLMMMLGSATPASLPIPSSPSVGLHTHDTLTSQSSTPAEHEPCSVLQATSSVANIEPENGGFDAPGPADSAVSSVDIVIQEHASVGEADGISSFVHNVSGSSPPYAAELSEDDGPDVLCTVRGLTIIPVYPPKDGSHAYLKVNVIT